jgi:quercetin dioxygenase-like cupin family protein
MTINKITIDPNAAIPAHIHPAHEEVLIIVDGIFSYELGNEKGSLTTGDTILILPQDRHYIINTSDTFGTVIAIFPVTTPERIMVE